MLTRPPMAAPAPVLAGDLSPEGAARRLIQGERLLMRGRYGHGADIFLAIDQLLPEPGPKAPYAVRREHLARVRAAKLRLSVPIRDHQLALKGAAPIGFLRELYPETPDFELALLHAQELRGAWEKYKEGTHLPVLGRRLHPFAGTYLPTRTEHLELFATWLSGYDGPKHQAIDVGTGAGVLAFLLARAGFERVLATDDNPNAIESVQRDLARAEQPLPIEPRQADLMGEDPPEADLVVFNPPWIPGEAASLVERALYCPPELMPRFFDRAVACMQPHTKLVLLYSNIGTLLRPDQPHPIQAELEKGRLVLEQKLRRKVKPPKGKRTQEKVELWVLAKA